MIITGARGVGKTVMLGVVGDLARGRGWDVVSETATRTLAGRLRVWMHLQAEDSPGVLVRGAGVVITVDEIHAVDRRELAQIGADLESIAEQGCPVALVVAGLPALMDEFLTDGSPAFLLSANRVALRNVGVSDIEESLGRTFTAGGIDLPSKILHQAAGATEGYPFMIQLVGYYLWREAEAQGGLTPSAAAGAIAQAQERLSRTDLN